MTAINVPTREEVSPANQALFDDMSRRIGMVPNIHATFAHSEHALGSYLAFQTAKTSLSRKAREVVKLVVSEVNNCEYCLAAHTVVGRMSGFTDEQMMEIRRGTASFDAKFDALARLTLAIVKERGHASPDLVDTFLGAGWTRENFIDAIIVIGDITISNYLHSTTHIPVDFPSAPKLT